MPLSLGVIALFLLAGIPAAKSAEEAESYVVVPIRGSTKKVCQLTGDFDATRGCPVLSRTFSQAGVAATDLGSSFEHNGRLYFLFGDTFGRPGARDALASTASRDPAAIELEFVKGEDDKWQPLTVPGIGHGGFEVPSHGVSIEGNIYVVFTTDHSPAKVMGRSVLALSRDNGATFEKLYELSSSRFINVAIWKSGKWLYIFGSGAYRASSVSLARVEQTRIEKKENIRYLSGITKEGAPEWTGDEGRAQPIFRHDVVGELSAAWCPQLDRYLLLYNSSKPRGIVLRTARKPWGPWSDAAIIFHPWRDKGYGRFMHVPPDRGKVVDSFHDPGRADTFGGEYGPFLMARYFTGSGTICRIYFTLSTWNPYQVVVMQSDLKLEPSSCGTGFRRLSLDAYRSKMKAGWIGQMAGVGWGAPTEFRYRGRIIPEKEMPGWRPGLINQFSQDDLYVEMTFLRSMEIHGLDLTIRQAGIDFANSRYPLWHANKRGRSNLRQGIAPPDSGHPRFNEHADDIDYQIEADFSGLIAPGLPDVVIELGEKFGRLMNYGDGLYGGRFVGGMYAEAFFENDPARIVAAGLRCIPGQSLYAETIRDVLIWHGQYPDDWEKTWKLVDEKYHRDQTNRPFSCTGAGSDFNIDAKINGAYIAIGLLYGKGDPDRTIVLAARCGQDSDCNPSSAGGVLFTSLGFSKLPERFFAALDEKGVFSHTAYDFPALTAVCEKLARRAVVRAGGRIEKGESGKEFLLIPRKKPKPGKVEHCSEPGPVMNSRFSESEMERISVSAEAKDGG